MNALPTKRKGGPPARVAAPKQSFWPENTPLPAFLQELIASPPQHGSGVHSWLFKVARQLHAHCAEQTIVALLTAAVDGCGRNVPQREILAAVEDACGCAWKPNGISGPVTHKPASKWPVLNNVKRQDAIQSAGIDLSDLWDSSPVRCVQGETDAEFFVDELFPGNPLLCVAANKAQFETAPRESFRGRLADLSLIVPSPMTALTGPRKKDRKESAHTLENTGPRHYLITEFDSGTQDEQAALMGHLSAFAPLTLVVSSGGKSLHGWWDCRDIAEPVTAEFFRYAVSIGADPATWTPSQFVRMPQGWRPDKERRQEVYFFNPEARKEPAR